jgi:hypothetical protein
VAALGAALPVEPAVVALVLALLAGQEPPWVDGVGLLHAAQLAMANAGQRGLCIHLFEGTVGSRMYTNVH